MQQLDMQIDVFGTLVYKRLADGKLLYELLLI